MYESFPHLEVTSQTRAPVTWPFESAACLTDREFWMPDELCLVCFDCTKPFSAIRRRHHCRRCGQVFCGQCCNSFVPNEDASRSPAVSMFGLLLSAMVGDDTFLRVCFRCYQQGQVTPESVLLNARSSLSRMVNLPLTTPRFSKLLQKRSTLDVFDAEAISKLLVKAFCSTPFSFAFAEEAAVHLGVQPTAAPWIWEHLDSRAFCQRAWQRAQEFPESRQRTEFSDYLTNASHVVADLGAYLLKSVLVMGRVAGIPAPVSLLLLRLVLEMLASVNTRRHSGWERFAQVTPCLDIEPSESFSFPGVTLQGASAQWSLPVSGAVRLSCLFYSGCLAYEYLARDNRVALEVVMTQEEAYWETLTKKLAALEVDVVFCQGAVACMAATKLRDMGISVFSDLSSELLERLATTTGGTVISDMVDLRVARQGRIDAVFAITNGVPQVLFDPKEDFAPSEERLGVFYRETTFLFKSSSRRCQCFVVHSSLVSLLSAIITRGLELQQEASFLFELQAGPAGMLLPVESAWTTALSLEPELDERTAIEFMHPSSHMCVPGCAQLLPNPLKLDVLLRRRPMDVQATWVRNTPLAPFFERYTDGRRPDPSSLAPCGAPQDLPLHESTWTLDQFLQELIRRTRDRHCPASCSVHCLFGMTEVAVEDPCCSGLTHALFLQAFESRVRVMCRPLTNVEAIPFGLAWAALCPRCSADILWHEVSVVQSRIAVRSFLELLLFKENSPASCGHEAFRQHFVFSLQNHIVSFYCDIRRNGPPDLLYNHHQDFLTYCGPRLQAHNVPNQLQSDWSALMGDGLLGMVFVEDASERLVGLLKRSPPPPEGAAHVPFLLSLQAAVKHHRDATRHVFSHMLTTSGADAISAQQLVLTTSLLTVLACDSVALMNVCIINDSGRVSDSHPVLSLLAAIAELTTTLASLVIETFGSSVQCLTATLPSAEVLRQLVAAEPDTKSNMALLLRDVSSACQGPRNCLLGRPFYVAAPEDPGPIIAAALVSDEHVGHLEGCPFIVCDSPGAPDAPPLELDSWVTDWADAVLSGDSQLQMSGLQFLQAQATFVTTWCEEAMPMTLAGALGKWRAMSLMVAEKRVEISPGPSRLTAQTYCPPSCWASRPLFTLATDWQPTKAVTDAKQRVIGALHDDDVDPDLTVTLLFGEFDIESKSIFSFLQQLGPLASPRHPLPPISETTLPRAASQHALIREQSTVEVTMVLPKHFHALRHLLCVDDVSLYRSLRRTTPFSGDGGKSGADFGLSADRRYIIKQLNPKEVRWFRTHGKSLLKRLIKIQQEQIESTIMPALGLFEVRYSRCFHLGLASESPANLADGAPEDVVSAHSTLMNRLNNSSRWKKCFLVNANVRYAVDPYPPVPTWLPVYLGTYLGKVRCEWCSPMRCMLSDTSLSKEEKNAKLLQSVGLQNFTAGNVDRSILIFDVKGVGCTRMKPTTHATIVQCDPEHLEQEAPRSMYEEPNGFPWTMVIREHVLKVVHVPNASSIPILWDQNWVQFTSGVPLNLPAEVVHRFHEAVTSDCSFLSSVEVIDYSLLLIVDIRYGSFKIHAGLIDFCRPYTWDKQIETSMKSLATMVSGIRSDQRWSKPTVISPEQYQDRFMNGIAGLWRASPTRPMEFERQKTPPVAVTPEVSPIKHDECSCDDYWGV